LPGDEGHEGGYERKIEKRGEVYGESGSRRQLERARFEPGSDGRERLRVRILKPSGSLSDAISPHKTKMLSIAIRNSLARRVPATATPIMLGRGFSNVYSEGSVAQSRGFKSVLRFRGRAESSDAYLFRLTARRKRPMRVRRPDIRNLERSGY